MCFARVLSENFPTSRQRGIKQVEEGKAED
jgi:hypothetical protein